MTERIEGRHPVREALRAGRRVDRILLADGARSQGVLAEIVRLAERARVPVARVSRAELDRLAVTSAHQGVVAEVAAYQPRPWQEGVSAARAAGRAPLVLAMDGIEDPQNAGALMRTAEAFGVDAVIVPKRRSAPMSAATAKASAGAIEHLVIDQVANLERALARCREEGLWIVSSSSEDGLDVRTCELLGEPVVVVVGSEGRGVSALIRQRSDAVVRIPLSGRVASLNASVAGALLLWESARRRELHH